MALLYNKFIGNTILDCAIRGITGQATSNSVVSLSQDWYIMSGPQPTPATAIDNWSTYYTSNRLFTGWNSNSTGIILTINNRSTPGGVANITSSGTRTAIASGTATWAVIATRVGGDPGSAGLTTDPSFMIVPVSDTTGNGILQLNTVNLTSGVSFTYNLILYMAGGSN